MQIDERTPGILNFNLISFFVIGIHNTGEVLTLSCSLPITVERYVTCQNTGYHFPNNGDAYNYKGYHFPNNGDASNYRGYHFPNNGDAFNYRGYHFPNNGDASNYRVKRIRSRKISTSE